MFDIHPFNDGKKRFMALRWATGARLEKLQQDDVFCRMEEDASVVEYCNLAVNKESPLEPSVNFENSPTEWDDIVCENVESPILPPSGTRLTNHIADTTQYDVTVALMNN